MIPRWPPGGCRIRARIDPFGQSRNGVPRCLAPWSAAGCWRRGARRCSRRPERPRKPSGQPSLKVALGCCTVASREDNRGAAAPRAFVCFPGLGGGHFQRTTARLRHERFKKWTGTQEHKMRISGWLIGTRPALHPPSDERQHNAASRRKAGRCACGGSRWRPDRRPAPRHSVLASAPSRPAKISRIRTTDSYYPACAVISHHERRDATSR